MRHLILCILMVMVFFTTGSASGTSKSFKSSDGVVSKVDEYLRTQQGSSLGSKRSTTGFNYDVIDLGVGTRKTNPVSQCSMKEAIQSIQ